MQRKGIVSIIAGVMVLQAQAVVPVHLDYTGFDANISSAWTTAGYGGPAALTPAEIFDIKVAVKTKLETTYAGLDVFFSPIAPGGVHEKILMGATTASTTTLGTSTGIDWRNSHKDDLAYVFAKNFAPIIMPGSHTRPENLERIKNALANTAAHEFAHNLGLQHYDNYGDDSVAAPAYTVAGDVQNTHIMATSDSGLTLESRGMLRSFGTNELRKLQYADGLSFLLGSSTPEIPGPNDTLATAQPITGSPLLVGSVATVNVVGSIDPADDTDIFKFFASAGSPITANTFSFYGLDGFVVDTVISLLSFDGTVLFSNDDISFDGPSFMGGIGPYTSDSLIQNFTASYTGPYYLKVKGFAAGETGHYNLLMSGLTAAVPEPTTIAVLGLGVVALARKRRKR